MELFRKYCEYLQQVIWQGASVSAEVNGRQVSILRVDCRETEIAVEYITSASPCQEPHS